MSVGRLVSLLLGAAGGLAVLAGAAPAAGAVTPLVGRYEGVSPAGARLSLTVLKHANGRRYVANWTASCVVQTEHGQRTIAGPFRRKVDPITGRPEQAERPVAYPISAGGVVDRYLITGRFRRASAVVRQSELLTGACDLNAAVKVRWVPSVAVQPGRWELTSPATGARVTFDVDGHAIGQYQGQFLTPSTPQHVIFPLPCTIGGGLLGIGAVLAEHAHIAADGSFATPLHEGEASLNGVFGEREGRGTYVVHEAGACLEVPFAFTARLVAPQPPPRVGGVELRSKPVLPRAPEPLDYVALGDSYSSGEGVPPFDRGTDTRNNKCHRSAHAYSRLFGLPGYRFRRSFFACSGAKTENVGRLDAASGEIRGRVQYPGESAVQLRRLSPAAWRATDMVTFTLGGDDAEFAPVLRDCLLHNCHKGARARRITERIRHEVRVNLASTYAAVRLHAWPNATVFVLGYPQLFPARPRARCPIGKRLTLTRAKQVFLRRRGRQLNAVMGRQATAAGFHFVDVERSFRGHEICGPKREWIHSLVLRKIRFSFHPKRVGQRAYARTLARYIRCLAAHRWPFLPSGMPENRRRRRVPAACA